MAACPRSDQLDPWRFDAISAAHKATGVVHRKPSWAKPASALDDSHDDEAASSRVVSGLRPLGCDCVRLLDRLVVAEFSEAKNAFSVETVAPTIRLSSLSLLEVTAAINPTGLPREFTWMA